MRTVSWRRTAHYWPAVLVLVVVAVAHAQPREVALQLPPHQQSRAGDYREAATRASAIMSDRLGTLESAHLTVVAVPWWGSPTPPDGGTVHVPSRWFALRGDRSLHRYVIAGLARHHWMNAIAFRPADQWLAGALVRYTAVAVASEMLESDHFQTPLFFGGAVAVPVRHASLSRDEWEGRPPPVTFDEVEAVLANVPGAMHARSLRAARALQTLERYLGRPAFETAVREFSIRARERSEPVTPADLIATIEGVAGRDLAWFFVPAFRDDARYDYGIASIATTPGAQGRHSSRVVVQRFGDAIFSGTSRPAVSDFEEGRAIEILVRFADGSEVVEHWDGRAESRILEYTSGAPLVDATVDPNVVLLLDEHWDNNRRTFAEPPRAAALQWSLLWMAWLQQFMLTMTAFA